MSERRVKEMSESDRDRLQEAGEDIAYLTQQEGYDPTDAIAKVASAAGFTKDQTKLLIFAYNTGLAAEKRANAGGPFERLAEYSLPDSDKIMEKVYGTVATSPEKTASAGRTVDLRWLDTDLSQMDAHEVRQMFYPGEKRAESEEPPEEKKRGLLVSQTSISISLAPDCEDSDCGGKDADDRFIDFIPKSAEEQMSAGLKMMSPELQHTIDSVLREMMRDAKEAQIEKYSIANEEYAKLAGLVTDFGKKVEYIDTLDSHKMAGYASVEAFYPSVAKLLAPFMTEVGVRKMKTASYRDLDVNRQHPWVAEARQIEEQGVRMAVATKEANMSKLYYDVLHNLYYHRPQGEFADWTSLVPVKTAGSLPVMWGNVMADSISGGKKLVNATVKSPLQLGHQGLVAAYHNPFGAATLDSVKKKDRESFGEPEEVREGKRRDVMNPLRELNRKDIATMSMLSDFSANDDILNAYSLEDIVAHYNDLVRTSPVTMRDRSTARAVLQQMMTQGRMAPTEYEPVLKLDQLLQGKG